MADLTSVGVTSGVPSSGTGTVGTINYLAAVGSPISNGSTSAPVTVAITGSASAVTSTMSALVVVQSPNSSVQTVTLSSNPTITSVSSGAVSITAGSNTANVLAGSSTVTSTMASLVVSLSSNGAGIIGTGTAGSPSSQFLSVQGSTSMTPLLVTSTGTVVTPSSNFTVIPSSVVSVTPSSNLTIGSGSISLVPTTAGGLTLSSVIMASGTNATLISSVPRQVYKVECFNNSANIGYLHLYNLASSPTVGSSLVFDRYLVPANASGAGVVSGMENGVPYTTGLSYTFTGGIADSDTTAVAASAFIVNIYYK